MPTKLEIIEQSLRDLKAKAEANNLPRSSVQLISMTTHTPLDLNKGGRGGNAGGYLGRITKRSKMLGVVGTHWQTIVNNWLNKQGENSAIALQDRKWGKRLPDQPLVEHFTKEGERRVYLEFFPVSVIDSVYYCDNSPANSRQIEEFFEYLKDRKKGSEVLLDNGETMRVKPVVRDYRIDHIEQLSMMGDILTVCQNGNLQINKHNGDVEVITL